MAVPARFVDLVRGAGDPCAVAVTEDGGPLTYEQLWDRVASRRRELGLSRRSLVLLSGPNSLQFIVTYLALLDEGHVPLLAGARTDAIVDAWQPDAVVVATRHGVEIERRTRRERLLHPDLALLLSTSGSTGSPKLVRLSQRNLSSNAAAIGDYLGLTAADRGITTLPLHYCYGLSVLHSHLLAGASISVTDTSVVDPCFIDGAAGRDQRRRRPAHVRAPRAGRSASVSPCRPCAWSRWPVVACRRPTCGDGRSARRRGAPTCT